MSPLSTVYGLCTMLFMAAMGRGVLCATTLYEFGNPSGDEQLQLELLNRARANSAAEGVLLAGLTHPLIVDYINYYGVNVSVMQSEMAAIPPVPPLAPNKFLTNAARLHSQWMLNTGNQVHDEIPGAPGGNVLERIAAAGYTTISSAENLYAYSSDPLFGHAGFEVDWGEGTYGMQNPRGHRINNHGSSFREIGVGIISGSANGMGPQVLTQDFGQAPNSLIFATGVAYYDLNANQFYDVGEGLAGLTVTSPGSSFHCLTAEGGGWVLPFPRAAGPQNITFSGSALAQSASVTINAGLHNVKLDLKLSYSIPSFTSANTGETGVAKTVAFTAKAGISSYRFVTYATSAAPPENAENANQVTAELSPGYSLVDPNVRQQGAASFHLAMPDGEEQIVELKTLFLGGTAPGILFQSRLGYATADQTAMVELREEGTTKWVPVYTQNGSDTQGEISWETRSAAVAGWSGRLFRMRLRYAVVPGGSYFADTDSTMAWFVDAIQFTNISALTQQSVSTLQSASTIFTPSAAGNYVLLAEPLSGAHAFPPGMQMLTVTNPTGFAAWALSAEAAGGLAVGAIRSSPTGDLDKDGQSNLYEYAFGTVPNDPNPPPVRSPRLICTESAAHYEYTINLTLSDLTIGPQVLYNGQATWKKPGETGAPAGFIDAVIATNGNLQTRRATLPMAGAQRALFRVMVQLK